ncbi:MAG: tyrosine-type recombinase/integrase [Deltaproteobacteria bacterium]|nr:tyrosine-type recombinase/integrase [Deltaproteobacteria bacterium]
MSVKLRPYKRGGWEVDIVLVLANGERIRRRFRSPVPSKSGTRRWGEAREQQLFVESMAIRRAAEVDRAAPATTKTKNENTKPKEVPTLAEFSPRYLEGYARANREKPSSVASKESILRIHLLPHLGHRRLDAIEQEDIQRLKAKLTGRASKTVNNVLTVLNTLLRTAVEWKVIEQMPVRIRLLKVAQRKIDFYDFDEYEQLVDAATEVDSGVLVLVLLGGEAGLRRGEMIGLEWTDIDFRRRLLTVERAVWRGHVTLPKGNRLRTLPMTQRLTRELKRHRHLRGPRILCREDGQPTTAKIVRNWLGRAQRRANMKLKGPHTLRHTFCSHLAMRGAPARAIQEVAGHAHLATTQRYMHLSPAALEGAIALLDGGRLAAPPPSPGILGDIVETGLGAD